MTKIWWGMMLLLVLFPHQISSKPGTDLWTIWYGIIELLINIISSKYLNVLLKKPIKDEPEFLGQFSFAWLRLKKPNLQQVGQHLHINVHQFYHVERAWNHCTEQSLQAEQSFDFV